MYNKFQQNKKSILVFFKNEQDLCHIKQLRTENFDSINIGIISNRPVINNTKRRQQSEQQNTEKTKNLIIIQDNRRQRHRNQ